MRRAALRLVFCSISFGVQVFGTGSLGENIGASMRRTINIVTIDEVFGPQPAQR